MTLCFSERTSEISGLTPDELEKLDRERKAELAEEHKEAKTSREWASVWGCGKDKALRLLKAGLEAGKFECIWVKRSRLGDGQKVFLPAYFPIIDGKRANKVVRIYQRKK